MKKVIKLALIVICILMAICQNSDVYALSEEVKKQINYQEGQPSEYDVEIDATEFIDDIQLPLTEVSLGDILYKEKGIFDINFFSTDGINTSTIWQGISGIVKSVFIATLYISVAVMLTGLIYMAIKVVSSSMSSNNSISNEHGFFKSFNSNSFGRLKTKRFIEKWMVSFVYIAILAFVINLVIAFSNVLVNATNTGSWEKKPITVFVKGGKTEGGSNIQDFSFETNETGVFFLQTQHNWSGHVFENVLFFVGVGILLLVNIVMYIILLLRMLTVGVIIAISPVLILLNTFYETRGNKSFLKKWVVVFLCLVFIKCILSVVYTVLANVGWYSVADNPAYVLFVAVFIAVLAVLYVRQVWKYIRKSN